MRKHLRDALIQIGPSGPKKCELIKWMTYDESTLCAKMLVKLTPGPGVNFTDISWEAFINKDPKSAKRHWWFDCLFALLGSVHVKAACKMLMKLIPGTGIYFIHLCWFSAEKKIIFDNLRKIKQVNTWTLLFISFEVFIKHMGSISSDFALVDPKSVKNTVRSSVSSYAFGIYKHKSCTSNVDEIEPRGRCYKHFWTPIS